jgi:hypothetical protein
MLVAQDDIHLERGNTGAEAGFTIKATAKAFDILSSGLYANKILAIIRELSCNAHDSHVAAGTTQPIEIRLPTTLDPTFYVKDFGTGLSDFDVRGYWLRDDGTKVSLEEGAEQSLISGMGGWEKKGGIYNTYFESTKTSSNDFIGQLGLGSKSPFSYTTSFMVESRHQGIRSLYTCFKNEQGMPSVALMGTEPTEDPNGVTVSLSVRPSDSDKFVDAARKALMYFDPKPVVIGPYGFSPYSLVHTVTGDSWRIRSTDYYADMNGPHVVQGFVSYPIDTYQLQQYGLKDEAALLANTDLDLYVPIGKVEVAASRESLSYVPATVTNLINHLQQAAQEMRSSFQSEFDKCKNMWEAMMLRQQYTFRKGTFSDIFKKMQDTAPFQYNDRVVPDELTLDLSKLTEVRLVRMGLERTRRSGYKQHTLGVWDPSNLTKKMEFSVHANLHLIVDDVGSGNVSKRVTEYLIKQGEVNGKRAQALLIGSHTKRGPVDDKQAQLVVDQFEGIDLTYVSELPQVVTVRSSRTYTKREPGEVYVWTGFTKKHNYYGRETGLHRKFSRNTWDTEVIDFEDGGIYVPIVRYAAQKDGYEFNGIHELWESARALGLVSVDQKLYGLNDKDLKKIQDDAEWVDVYTYVRDAFDDANVDDRLFAKNIVDSVSDQLGRPLINYMVKNWDSLSTGLQDGPFKELMAEIVQLAGDATVNHPAEHIRQVIAQLRIADGDRVMRHVTLTSKWQSVVDHYPMLTFVNFKYADDMQIRKIIKYVNAIDG